MAWTSPRTWSACEVVTAAIMNTHVRDNFLQTFPALVTTKGDSVWGTGANAGQRVGVGTLAATVIIANSGCSAGVAWSGECGSPLQANNLLQSTVPDSPSSACGAKFLFYTVNGSSNWAGMGNYNGGQIWSRADSFAWFPGGTGGACPKMGMFLSTSALFLGPASANANLTAGVTVHQGSNNDEILAFLSSNACQALSHGASTFGYFQKVTSTEGGLKITGVSGAAGGGAVRTATMLEGFTTNDHSVHSTAGSATVTVNANTVAATNTNVFGVAVLGAMQVIVSGTGDIYANAGINASAYDNHDDVALVRALELERAPASVVKDTFDAWVKYNRRDLEAADIATFNDKPGEDGSTFINITGLQRLQSGAIWQLHKRNRELEERLAQMQTAFLEKIAELERRLLAAGPPAAV